MPQPAVSVVLCTYNGAAFLAGQLTSIINQTHPLHEIIIVDDGSADGTLEIIARFAAQCPIIKWQQNERNLGYNKNFEKALSLATGDVIAIADQDDLWHLQKIEALLQHWPLESPLIYSDSVLFSGQVPEYPKPGRLINRLWGNDPRKLALYNTVSGHAMMLRRSLLQLALPFNSEVYYDWWLAVVAMANGGIIYHPQILVFQRRHQYNASLPKIKTAKERFTKEKLEIECNLRQFCGTPNMNDSDQKFFNNLHRLWCAAMEGKEQAALFRFLIRHRKIIFSSKKRTFALLSQIKRSFRYAFKKV